MGGKPESNGWALDVPGLQRAGRLLERLGVPGGSALTRKLMKLLFHAYLPTSTQVGSGTVFGYNGIGCFVHPQARIGRHCLISQFVTVGGRSGMEGGAELGDYVRVGIGAKILGPVKIGSFAVIGANAVVTRDVPAGAVAGGVPAKVIKQLADPIADYERATGLSIPAEDRAAWEVEASTQPLRRPERPTGSALRPGGNQLATDSAALFEEDRHPMDPQRLGPPSASPATPDDEIFA